jgi:uncharacterized membrane protein YfcA
MVWSVLAGGLAGLVLGLLGAGGTVIGLPVLLYLAHLRPHTAMGTNAAGVALVALALLAWRALRGGVPWCEAIYFTVPGVAGNLIGAHLGLVFPGRRLIFLLGILLFAVAGWLVYLSLHGDARAGTATRNRGARSRWLMMATAFLIGGVAGLFDIGGAS